jgi:Tfp pilus assembly protein PilN
MKFPFLEHSVVALDVRSDVIRWVELNRVGNRLSYSGYGEFNGGGPNGLREYLPRIKEQIQADAYRVSCSLEGILIELEVEDVPYTEEQEEIEAWITTRKQEYMEQYETPVQVSTYVMEMNEDHQRCLFQMASQEALEEYLMVLQEQDIFPWLLTSGVSESGYALIYEDDFISGHAAVLAGNGTPIVCCYQNGLFNTVFNIERSDETSMAEEADSYLRSQEVLLELPQYTMPLYVVDGNSKDLPEYSKRTIKSIKPLESKFTKVELNPKYALACGVAVKTFFPTLDAINFASKGGQEKGKQWEEKKETVRTVGLLFAPVIVILLVLFAIEGYLDVHLTETGQVLEQLSDNIEQVNKKTEAVNAATVSYRQVRELVNKRMNSARLFELVSAEIPPGVWLESMNVQHTTENNYVIIVDGIAIRETFIARFMGSLENREMVKRVELISSRKIELNEQVDIASSKSMEVNSFTLRAEVSN